MKSDIYLYTEVHVYMYTEAHSNKIPRINKIQRPIDTRNLKYYTNNELYHILNSGDGNTILYSYN